MAIPPPPYDDITGIYTTDDKHQNVSKANYDGNAKPGQLVVDTTDYSLWIGNANGYLNQVTGGGGSYGNSNVVLYAETGFAGNIIPASDSNYSLGNATNQWLDLYVSNSSIYINNVAISVTGANILQVAGNDVITSNSTSSVSTTGNVTANYFIGNGSLLTGIGALGSSISNGTSNVDIPTANGNVEINANGTGTWTFDDSANLSIPGNIIGVTNLNNGHLGWEANSSGDGLGYTTLRLVPDDTRISADQYLILDPTAPGHIHVRAGGAQDNSSADLFFGGENSYFKVSAGTNAAVSVASNSFTWTFDTDGNLNTTGNINANLVTANNITSSSNVSVGNVTVGTGSGGSLTGANLINANFFLTSVSTAVSANGADQANATLLASSINLVDTVNTGEGVKLPAIEGTVFYIINNTANTLEVYPSSGGQINLLGTNANYTQSANSTMQYTSSANTQWWTIGAN